MGGFPSGQRGQTVNLLQIASVVRIHLHPFDFAAVAQFLVNIGIEPFLYGKSPAAAELVKYLKDGVDECIIILF